MCAWRSFILCTTWSSPKVEPSVFFSWPKAILFLTPLIMKFVASLVGLLGEAPLDLAAGEVPLDRAAGEAPLDRAAGEVIGFGEGVYLGDGVPAEIAGLPLAGLGVLCEVLGETSGPSTL